MLAQFKNLLRAFENSQIEYDMSLYACRLTTRGYSALVDLTRVVYGETASEVVRSSFTEAKDGHWIAGKDLVEAFSLAIKGPT